MARPWFLFALLLAMCALLGTLFFIQGPPYGSSGEASSSARIDRSHGFPHGSFPTMQQGDAGPARRQRVFWLGVAFGVLIAVFCVACLAWGAVRQGSPGPWRRSLEIGAAVYALIFVAIFLSYRPYMRDAGGPIFLGQPISSLLLFAVWGFPLFFAFLFYRYFDSWYVTPSDRERFRELTAAARRPGQTGE